MQLLKIPSRKGQVTLDSIIGLTVTLLIIGFLIGIALIMNQGFTDAADQWMCPSGYGENFTTNDTCCLIVGDNSSGDCDQPTNLQNPTSVVNDTIGNISTSFSDIAGWMPLIALAVIAVIIIGLMMIFRGAGGRGI